MQVFWVFPEVTAREKKKRVYRGQPHKYDHWQMLIDRLSGMRWSAIEKKHGVPPRGINGEAARLIVCRSRAIKKLSPKEVEAIFPRMF